VKCNQGCYSQCVSQGRTFDKRFRRWTILGNAAVVCSDSCQDQCTMSCAGRQPPIAPVTMAAPLPLPVITIPPKVDYIQTLAPVTYPSVMTTTQQRETCESRCVNKCQTNNNLIVNVRAPVLASACTSSCHSICQSLPSTTTRAPFTFTTSTQQPITTPRTLPPITTATVTVTRPAPAPAPSCVPTCLPDCSRQCLESLIITQSFQPTTVIPCNRF